MRDPDNCLPVLCVPPSLGPCDLFCFVIFLNLILSQEVCFYLFCEDWPSLGPKISPWRYDLSDHGPNTKSLNLNSQEESDWPMGSQWVHLLSQVSVSVPTGCIQVHKHGCRDHSCGWEGLLREVSTGAAGTLANMSPVGEDWNDLALNKCSTTCRKCPPCTLKNE